MKRVFISYSRQNKAFAERLARDLDDAGLEVWIDFRQITGGELWQNEIYRGIERSEFVIFCMSPSAISSVWCNREITIARQQNKLIIPIMVLDAYDDLSDSPSLRWILDIHFISFIHDYETAYTQLLESLPGARPIGVYDEFDPIQAQNPFKGLEAFQQTDAHFFFGRDPMIQRSLQRVQTTPFLAFVGASGSGKSSLVRAGILPALRKGKIAGSDTWQTAIFTPGEHPLEALVTRVMPYLKTNNRTVERVIQNMQDPDIMRQYVDDILSDTPPTSRLVIIVDQFEEVFTRASSSEAREFVNTLVTIATTPDMRVQFMITMRADFFGSLSQYPRLAQLFEAQNMIIVTEMTAANIRRAIEDPVKAVGLHYEDGLVDRILDDVRSQPGSLPLLQYALHQLFDKRQGAVLTHATYDDIGGVQRALAQHAEEIYSSLTQIQQNIARRLLLHLVEVGNSGEATRRRVPHTDLTFDDIHDGAVHDVLDILTAAGSRLVIASREINIEEDSQSIPIVWYEVSHEALIREWSRFRTWVSAHLEDLQYSTELRRLSQDWMASGRDAAYLLVGKRLNRAEIWLENADANELQRAYINASVKAHNQREDAEKARQQRELNLERKNASRLRLLALVLVIGFIGSIIASIVLMAQRNTLELITAQLSQRTLELEAESAQSLSLALSAEADRAFADRETDLALALALEASNGTNAPIRAQSTLNRIALAAGTRQRIDTDGLTILSLADNPTGTQVTAGLDNGEIITWSVISGEIVSRWQAHTSGVTSIAYHPNGTRIVSGSSDTSDNLRVWDATSGALTQSLPYHTTPVTSIQYTPDGAFFVSTSTNTPYIVWSNETLSAVTSGAYDTYVQIIDATQDLSANWTIATADTRSITTLNSAWATVTTIRPSDFGIAGDVTSMRIKADGAMIIAGFTTGEVGLWNARNGTLVQTFPSSGSQAVAVDFLPRDNKIIAGFDDGTMRIWDIVTARQTDAFMMTSPIHHLSINPTRGRMIVAQKDELRIWDIQGSEELQRFIGHDGQVAAVAYHPTNQFILSGSFDTTLMLWNAENAQALQSFVGHTGAVVALDFNGDGSRFISSANDQTVRIWTTHSNEMTRIFTEHTSNVRAVTWHPSSTQVASGDFDNRILIWDADTGIIQHELLGHTGAIASLQFSPDGTLLLSGSFDDTLKLWDVATGEELQTFSGHTASVSAGRFNQDATQIISGASDNTIRTWDVTSGRELRRFEGHDRVINQVAFVTDSNAIMSASADGTLRLWDTLSGSEIYRYSVVNSFGRSIAMRSVTLSKDGRRAITGMSDGTIRQWQILPTIDSLIQWTQDNRFVPQLDCNEEILFGLQTTHDMGQQVFINSEAATINLLLSPTDSVGTGAGVSGESASVIDQQTLSDGRTFYQVCSDSSAFGWIEDTVLDGISEP